MKTLIILSTISQNGMKDFLPLKKSRKSINGDLVLFDYIGKIDNKEFANGAGKDETVVLGF